MNFIESYMNNSFVIGDNAFTNLLIAVPIVATIVLLFSNFIRTKLIKHIPNGLFDCKFISITLICYAFIVVAITSLFNCQLSTAIILVLISGYIPFLSLSWCIYKECCLPSDNEKSDNGDNSSYAGEFTEKIRRKIQQIRDTKKAKNILINGSWGAGKSYFIEKHLIPSQSFIYISCTDYAETHELISALITKTNNYLFRWLVRLSISRLLAVLGKYELKEFIGVNKVIVFDEFERLVDYNKIDPMHIVSLIQYLNNQKNCICILVANEDHLNNASQFTNVREKLISYFYRYNIGFDEVLRIIQEDNLVDVIDLNDSNFGRLKQHFQYWYQIDNNIRMMKHLYIKVNELYQATHQMVQEDDFYKHRFNDINKIDKLFSGLSSYVDTVLIQLYYLYLKNPYFLTVIEKFAGIYHDDTFIKEIIAKYADKNKNRQKPSDPPPYFIKESLQELAAIYIEEEDYQRYSEFVACFKEILSNAVFAKIDQKLIIDYLANLEFVVAFLEPNEITSEGTRQSIEFFIRRFKETICESDDLHLLINYFKRVNILEEGFRQLIDDIESPWDNDIVTDYIAYCEYINQKRSDNKYRKKFYVNALIIQRVFEQKESNTEQIISEINNFKRADELIGILYERTCLEIINKNKILELIKLIKEIADKLDGRKYELEVGLYFIHSSYSEIQKVTKLYKAADYKNIVVLCNEKLIDLLTIQNKSKDFIMHLFVELSNFNTDRTTVHFPEDSLVYLVDKIKAVFNTQESLTEVVMAIEQNVKGQIAKDVIDKLKKELNKQNNQKTE